jgi:hypothetical protein
MNASAIGPVFRIFAPFFDNNSDFGLQTSDFGMGLTGIDGRH